MLIGLGEPVAAAQPAGSAPSLPPVEILGTANPVSKSYRDMRRGVALFARRHALAPDASLRFRLLPRERGVDMQDVSLRVVGDKVSVPIAVAADNTFEIPVVPAINRKARVVANREAGSMTWRVDIRTPGLPDNARRLGDLRLECLVGMEAGLISNNRPSILGAIGDLIEGADRCGMREPRYLFFTDRPLWRVTLVHGNRREVLSVDRMYAGVSRSPMTREDLHHCDCEVLLERTYFAPLSDPRWPDDTLLEFGYFDGPAEGQP